MTDLESNAFESCYSAGEFLKNIKEIHLPPQPDLGGVDPAEGPAQDKKKMDETIPF